MMPHHPVVTLNHLYLTVDRATFDAVVHSAFLRNVFAGMDGGLPEFKPIAAGDWRLYLRGQHTYIELLAPDNSWKKPIGKIGIGLSVERQGDIDVIQALYQEKFGKTAMRALVKRQDNSPWYHVVYREDDPKGRPGDTQGEPIDLWVSEYHADFLRTLRPDATLKERGVRREDFLRPVYRSERLLQDITGMALTVDAVDRAALREELTLLGFAESEGEDGVALRGAENTIELLPETTPNALTLRLRLSRSVMHSERLGSSRWESSGSEATWRFERRK